MSILIPLLKILMKIPRYYFQGGGVIYRRQLRTPMGGGGGIRKKLDVCESGGAGGLKYLPFCEWHKLMTPSLNDYLQKSRHIATAPKYFSYPLLRNLEKWQQRDSNTAKLAQWLSCVVSTYLYSSFDCIPLLPLKLQILGLFWGRSSLTFRQLWSVHSL